MTMAEIGERLSDGCDSGCLVGLMGMGRLPSLLAMLHVRCADKCPLVTSTKANGRYHPHGRYPRSVTTAVPWVNGSGRMAFYFDGKERAVRLNDDFNNFWTATEGNDKALPRNEFTLAVWIKPEGGQSDPAVIVELADGCSEDGPPIVWRLGIGTKTAGRERDAHYFLQIQTEMSTSSSTLWSHYGYTAHRWTHLAVTYQEQSARLYANGALVATSEKQVGPLFSKIKSSCKHLLLGGPMPGRYDDGQPTMNYRGVVDELKLWSRAKSAKFIRQIADDHTLSAIGEDLFLWARFDAVEKWKLVGEQAPMLMPSDLGAFFDSYALAIPRCGQTICDHPDVIQSYSNHHELRQPKVLRYAVVNLVDGASSQSTVTAEQISLQHSSLNAAFSVQNISWQLSVSQVVSSQLRHKKIVFGCDFSKIGNKHCDVECRHPITGNDNGDCDDALLTKCTPSMLHNERCDPECNYPEFGWDHGDCCNESLNTDLASSCIDPNSPHRAYLSIEEYKRALNVSNERSLSVAFVEWSNGEMIGLSTFPWEKHVASIYGGVVVQPRRFGTHGHLGNLIHEFGHALGLWHVHHGVSEMTCDDPCRETKSSLLHGDLCEDTNPTPKNVECRDPEYSSYDRERSDDNSFCEDGHRPYVNTPFSNYMSYSDGECANHFTPQQAARMHCYIDLKYSRWMAEPQLPTDHVPLSPKVIRRTNSSVTFAWLPPLGYSCKPTVSSCHADGCTCESNGQLLQYASRILSHGGNKLTSYWTPEQALGPPDADPCEASTKAWLPDAQSCDQPGACSISFGFDVAVVPAELRLWVSWNAADGLRQLMLYYTDGSVSTVSPVTAFCDTPFSVIIETNKTLAKLEVETETPFVSIDAVQVISKPGHPLCSECAPLEYQVVREPPFRHALYRRTTANVLVDTDVSMRNVYVYRVGARTPGALNSASMSPPLVFSPSWPFCGDGVLDPTSEACDDGNVMDYDGCSMNCQIEEGFSCSGSPSLCFSTSGTRLSPLLNEPMQMNDVSSATMASEFYDQWAVRARSDTTGPKCDPSLALGAPKSWPCRATISPAGHSAWQPCSVASGKNSWIELEFDRPVVASSVFVHLAADGDLGVYGEFNWLRLELISTDNRTVEVRGSRKVLISCAKNPIEYPVWHDLSKAFFYSRAVRIYVTSERVALAGVRLRSRRFFDPVTVDLCARSDMFYSPAANACISNRCSMTECETLRIEHADIHCSGKGNGDSCLVTCINGHRIVEDASSTASITKDWQRIAKLLCLNGFWTPSKVKCQPIDCGVPEISRAKVTCLDGTSFGAKCFFYCVYPAVMKGTNNNIVCGDHGVWSVPEAYCQLSCAPLQEQELNGRAVNKMCRINFLTLDPHSISFPVGTKCRIVCKAGYHVEGYPVSKRLLKRSCDASGHWRGARCVKIKCAEPKLVYRGLYNCSKGFEVGSQCTFHCPGKAQVRESVCMTDGTWSSADPCVLNKEVCPPPAIPAHILISCPSKRHVGTTCQVTCEAQGYDPVLEHIVTTDRRFKMQMLQKLEQITCSLQRKWEPNPNSLVCVRRCTKDFIKDGWCDFQNNRGYCGWDGGDCCASTVKDGKVKLMFPTLCTSHLCRCLDPYAIENRNEIVRQAFIKLPNPDPQESHWIIDSALPVSRYNNATSDDGRQTRSLQYSPYAGGAFRLQPRLLLRTVRLLNVSVSLQSCVDQSPRPFQLPCRDCTCASWHELDLLTRLFKRSLPSGAVIQALKKLTQNLQVKS